MKYYVLLIVYLYLSASSARAQIADSLLQHAVGSVGRKVQIGHIIMEGNRITRSSVILREIDIRDGDSVSVDSIDYYMEENKLRLFNLQLFNEVAQDIVMQPGSGRADWIIRVKERFPVLPSLAVQFADRNFNTWFVKENHDLRRAMIGVTLTDKNFRGNLETLGVTVQGGYTQKLALNYMMPYLDKDQVHGIGITGSYAESRQTYYATDSDKLAYIGAYNGPVMATQADFGLSYIYRPAYASRHTLRLVYRYYRVGDTVLKLNPGYFANQSTHASLLELQYRYEYNGVDNWNYPLQGNKLVFISAVRNGFSGVNVQGFATLEAGAFRRLAPGWFSSIIFRGRAMGPGDQPYFFLGGLGSRTDYVRGYEYFVIDGDHYGLLRLDLKRSILAKTFSFPIRYFTAVPLRIYPKIFADAGYISAPHPGNSYLGNKMLYSYGAGMDIVSLYDVKIRLEYCVNHLGQTGLFLHFNSE